MTEATSNGCPCLWAKRRCQANCSCADSFSSAGCLWCAGYGSLDQRRASADAIVATADAAQALAEAVDAAHAHAYHDGPANAALRTALAAYRYRAVREEASNGDT